MYYTLRTCSIQCMQYNYIIHYTLMLCGAYCIYCSTYLNVPTIIEILIIFIKTIHVHIIMYNYVLCIREIKILRKLRHRNVIELVEVFEDTDKQKLYVVLEYCVGGLQEMLDKTPGNRFPIWQSHK